MPQPRDASRPWMPVEISENTIADIACLKAIARGDATEEQQLRGMAFILEVICDRHGMSYRPDSPRDTDFAEGKRFVGNQIVKLSRLDLTKLRKGNVDGGTGTRAKSRTNPRTRARAKS